MVRTSRKLREVTRRRVVSSERRLLRSRPKPKPLGKLLEARRISELARMYCPEAIETLAEIMRDRSRNPRDRAYCAAILLDRGVGRAPQVVKLGVDNEERSGADAQVGERVAATARQVLQIARILQSAGALELVLAPGGHYEQAALAAPGGER